MVDAKKQQQSKEPKMYRCRKGYVLVGKDGKPTGSEVIMDNDPMFESQRQKLEPYVAKPPAGETTAPEANAGMAGAPQQR